MTGRSILVLLFVVLAGVVANGQQVEWINDIGLAQKMARETGKPILYDFTASWCGPCRSMDRSFWPKPEVVQMSKGFVCVKVNYDIERKGLAARYGVSAIPNVVFTDPWGRSLSNQLGFLPATTEAQITEKIRYLPKDFTSVMAAGNTLEKNEKNVDALYQMADFYQERKFFWFGQEFLKRLVTIETDPLKRENVLVNLAYNYIRIGDTDEAVVRFENLMTEYPKSPQGDVFLYGLMFANIKKNKIEMAEKLLADLRQRFPRSALITQADQNLASTRGEKK